MERYLGLDVHAASCTLAVISQAGKRLMDFPIETHGEALVEGDPEDSRSQAPGLRGRGPERVARRDALPTRR